MGPVFVIGPPRCGTTLMLDLLAAHPQVSAHGEDFHRFHHSLVRLRDRQSRDEHFRLTTADAAPELALEYREAIAAALAAARRPQFVLKISTLSIQVDFVKALVPEARFIQLVRDGRDAMLSSEGLRLALEAEQGHPRALGPAPDPFGLWCVERLGQPLLAAAANWYYHVTRSWLDLGFAGGDAFLRLRYDDLLADPGGVMTRVLRFVGLPEHRRVTRALADVRDRPGRPGGLGFSTTQARGERRVGRFADELSPDLRLLVAPLFATPLALLGYEADAEPDGDALRAAAARLGVDGQLWADRVSLEREWFELHRRTFAPERLLRQPDEPRPTSRPLLVDGAVAGSRALWGDGQAGERISWVHKQDRRHVFADAGNRWPSLAPRLDGRTTVEALEREHGLGAEERALLARLHGLGFVGYA